MASFNKIILMGNITRDPEMRYTSSNQAVAKLGVACNRRYTTVGGEKREEVMFVDCEAWGRTAEVMNQYLSKGRPIFIEGRLKLDQWTDQSGQKRSRHVVVVENFQFIDSRGGSDDLGGNRANQRSSNYASAPDGSEGDGDGDSASSSAGHHPIGEDDIPF